MNEDKVKEYINNYLLEEQVILDGSDFFFDALAADISSTKIVDNTQYHGLKADAEDNKSKVDFNIDSRVIKESQEG
jgi:hypothetical protein